MRVVNLARRPFVNKRPVNRLTLTLWALGAVLLAWNLDLYVGFWVESADIRAEIAQVEEEIRATEESFSADLDQQFAAIDLEALNKQAVRLNELIEDRTFPWNQLFEDLEEVLPADVKLENLEPEVVERKKSKPRRSSRRRSSKEDRPTPVAQPAPAPAPEEVALKFRGVARSEESLIEFVEALFAHDDAFRDPTLTNDSLDNETRTIHFNLDVVYITRWRDAVAAEAMTAAAEGETPPDGGVIAEDGDEDGDEPETSPSATAPVVAAGDPDDEDAEGEEAESAADDEAAVPPRIGTPPRPGLRPATPAPSAPPPSPAAPGQTVPPRIVVPAVPSSAAPPSAAPPSSAPSVVPPSTPPPGPRPATPVPSRQPTNRLRPSPPPVEPVPVGPGASGTPRLQSRTGGGGR